jgi:CRP-like cAMP-binding protein
VGQSRIENQSSWPSRRTTGRELARSALIAALPEDRREQLARSIIRRRYARRETIAGGGLEANNLFLIVSGQARVYVVSGPRQRFTCYEAGPGDLIDLCDLPQYLHENVFAEAMRRDTVAYQCPRERFLDAIMSSPTATRLLLSGEQRRHATLLEVIAELALYDAQSRLSHALAHLAVIDNSMYIERTHEELAQMVGITRENVTRTLHRLHERGLIALRPHQRGIRILDIERLSRQDGTASSSR